jgi:hypothetical protein
MITDSGGINCSFPATRINYSEQLHLANDSEIADIQVNDSLVKN